MTVSKIAVNVPKKHDFDQETWLMDRGKKREWLWLSEYDQTK